MEILTRAELSYIATALEFQIDHDDDDDRVDGESASRKIAFINDFKVPNEVFVLFHWQETDHACEDCNLPGVFYARRFGSGSKSVSVLCAVCAANSAADDGAQIERIHGYED